LRKEFKLAIILEATGFPRSTYMYWQKRFNENNPDEEIEGLIKEIFEEHKGSYGYRRIDTELRNRGHIVNPKKILRLMRKLNIKLINRRFYKNVPHKNITTDTTEFKYYTSDSAGNIIIKKAYLDPFLDMFNGEILSFRLSKKPNAKAIIDALDETIERTKDCP